MNIKRMTAGIMAGVMMMGTVSTTCFAASPDVTAETTAETVQADENATTTEVTTADDNTVEADASEEATLPYEVTVDEEGNYTFSFGDWEWSTADDEEEGTNAEVNDKVHSYLNLRSGSGMEYEIIGHLLPGAEVQVVSEDGDWYQVVVPERTGYVYKDYVDLLEAENESGNIDEEFLAMMLYLMMTSMNQTDASGSAALTPDGNLTLVDDIGSSTGEGQQFITLVTKSGNYFYLIIDRNEKGEENVHFLNMVDEADLFALMDEDQVAAYQTTTDVEEEPVVVTPSAEDTEDTENETQVEEKKSMNLLPIVFVILILAGCGGGYFYLQTKKKKTTEQKPDPDADYTEEDEEELEIPEDSEDENEYLDEEDSEEEGTSEK